MSSENNAPSTFLGDHDFEDVEKDTGNTSMTEDAFLDESEDEEEKSESILGSGGPPTILWTPPARRSLVEEFEGAGMLASQHTSEESYSKNFSIQPSIIERSGGAFESGSCRTLYPRSPEHNFIIRTKVVDEKARKKEAADTEEDSTTKSAGEKKIRKEKVARQAENGVGRHSRRHRSLFTGVSQPSQRPPLENWWADIGFPIFSSARATSSPDLIFMK